MWKILNRYSAFFDEVDDADEVRQMLKDAYIIKVKNGNEYNESREEFYEAGNCLY